MKRILPATTALTLLLAMTAHSQAVKPQEVVDEDQLIAAMKLAIAPEAIRVTPVDEVFAR